MYVIGVQLWWRQLLGILPNKIIVCSHSPALMYCGTTCTYDECHESYSSSRQITEDEFELSWIFLEELFYSKSQLTIFQWPPMLYDFIQIWYIGVGDCITKLYYEEKTNLGVFVFHKHNLSLVSKGKIFKNVICLFIAQTSQRRHCYFSITW